MRQEEPNKYVKELTQEKYKYGFTTDVHTDVIEKGLNEDIIRLISEKKGEPDWMLEFRLKAYRHWLTLEMPTWAHLRIPEIDYQAISYYADPTKKKEGPKSMDEVDPELIKTFNKLGIPLEEQMALSGMAVDAVMDSVSVKTTFKETLMEKGIIFCSMSEAIREHPDLVQKYLGSVVPYRDNFFAALNSAVFSLTVLSFIFPKECGARWNCLLIFVSMRGERGSLSVRSLWPMMMLMFPISKAVLLLCVMRTNCMLLS